MTRTTNAVAALAIVASALLTSCGDDVSGPDTGGLVFVDLVAGGATCGLTSLGAAYCWGGSPQTGVGDGQPDAATARLSPVPVVGGYIFAGLARGAQHTCGWTLGGIGYCWGNNFFRQLGSSPNDGVDGTIPKLVSGDVDFAQIVAGTRSTCGLTAFGVAYCWGSNEYGALGGGQTVVFSETPLQVGGLISFANISMGGFSGCGITITGAGRCWGRNNGGQLGDGSTTDRSTPVAVSGDRSWVQIAPGDIHSCGITANGATYCWGVGATGQLGIGVTENRTTPALVTGGHTFVQVGVGQTHSCGLDNVGEIYCWGSNVYGQLGDGTETSSNPAPVKVSGNLRFHEIAVGDWHTCAIAHSGTTYCWGDGNQGELGNGTAGVQRVPTAVQ